MRIVSDRETYVISKFWERLYETMASQLNLSSAYYPQTDGQTKQVNQIPENMLYSMKEVGITVCLTPSSPILTAIKKA
jgi:hypothetical protein